MPFACKYRKERFLSIAEEISKRNFDIVILQEVKIIVFFSGSYVKTKLIQLYIAGNNFCGRKSLLTKNPASSDNALIS